MAAIMQQSSDVSAARAFWNGKMGKYPNFAGGLAVVLEIAGFFLNGHFLVWLGQRVISIAGRIAQTSLLFAVLWISTTSVAPGLVELFMSEKSMQFLVWLALVTLAVIPEIILGNAIVNAAGHWQRVTRDRYSVMAWVWAIAFTIPTLLFLGLTALTLNALVSTGGNFVQASTGLVGWRCFAGWSYGLLDLVYAGIGRKTLTHEQPIITPMQQANGDVLQELRSEMLARLAQMSEQITGIQTMQITAQSEPVEETECDNTEAQIVDIEDYRSNDQPPVQPCAKVTRKLTTRNEPTAKQKAQRIVKRNPGISASELATKANISRQYARTILAEQA